MADPTTPPTPTPATPVAATDAARADAAGAVASASGATEAVTPTPLPQKSPEDLVADIHAARADLEKSLEQLKSATQPKALAERSKNNAIGFFQDEYGGIRIDRIAMVGAGVVGFLLYRRWRRSRRCRC